MSCCCGSANWKREEVPDHKFDFIDVRDYYSKTFFTRIRYAWVFIMVAKGIAVYIADIYTAITLLAFHRFNGAIYQRVQNESDNPLRVPFDYGRWIFTGCIIFSFCLLLYEAHKARNVVRSRDISYAYTNVMANNYYSMRSYDHFCFFCQLNNSKKKKDELAFFIFFTFKGWKRLLVADGPRQVINGLTLYALGRAANWSTDLNEYYLGNYFTLIFLLTMIFTVVIFAGSFILLILACLMYLPLICYIQGNLKEYCCHKIDKRISELVQKKKKQRLGKYAAIARAEAAGDFKHLMNKKGIIVGQKIVQPTLPQLDVDLYNDDSKPKQQNFINRTGSISSSTMNGMHGQEKAFYGMGEGDDYGSTAQLMFNQGYAGSVPGHGHAIHGSNLSLSSGTLNNSPDAYPVHVRGQKGTMSDGQAQSQEGGLPIGNILAQMGPIGTSPNLFAQRKVGHDGNGGGVQNGYVDQYGQQQSQNGYDANYASDGFGGGSDGFGGMQGGHEAYEMHDQSGRDQGNRQYMANEGMKNSYLGDQYGEGDIGNQDLSSYAPYHSEPENGQQLHPDRYNGAGGMNSHGNSRVQSFAFEDVYDAYLQEPAHDHQHDSYGQASHDAHGVGQAYGTLNDGYTHTQNQQQGGQYGHQDYGNGQNDYYTNRNASQQYGQQQGSYQHHQQQQGYGDEMYNQQSQQQYQAASSHQGNGYNSNNYGYDNGNSYAR